jgi:hypothetical protein
VQHPQAPRGDVAQRPGRRAHLAARERDRDRVHPEVAPAEILLQRGRSHVGQCSGRRVGLRARARGVDPPAVGRADLRGAEAPVLVDDLAEGVEHRLELPLHGHVEVAHGRAQERVADRSADQPEPWDPVGRGQHRGPAGEPRKALQDCFRRRVH